MRVLLLDDNPDDRKLVLHELKGQYPDCEAIEVIDETRFGEVLGEAEPALVVTDLDLRWLNGIEVLKRVKATYPDCPVIMFTGTGDETVAVDAMKAGLDDYVVKSGRQLPRLRASIRQVIEGSERKRTLRQREAELRAAMEHKDLVLRELHHRVKNNIQIMTSLLWMRARQTPSEAVRAELEDILGRMQVLGQVQARIYETEELDQVDFRAVLEDVARSLVGAHGGEQIRLELNLAEPLELPVQRAMPLALLVYEVILNGLKHGLQGRPAGRLSVGSERTGEGPVIRVSDDGEGFDPEQVQAGIGTRLIEALAREAGARIERSAGAGGGAAVAIRL
jgi:two-component sensor histidine kinase/CheY-like chemotaxis protein